MASVMVVDFSKIDHQTAPLPLPADIDPATGRARRTSRKQLRARTRRKVERTKKILREIHKPVEEWDNEELSRGRPRAQDGSFRGSPPPWVTREVHEEAMTRFRNIVKDEMNGHTLRAVGFIGGIMGDDERDDKGKPITPAGTKLDAAKFLVEHVMGKPKQRVETDLNVRIQGMLATTVISPNTIPAPPPRALGPSRDREGISWIDDEDQDIADADVVE